MPEFSLASFETELLRQLPESFDGKLCVAFSGGLDSAVLLLAVADLRSRHGDWRVRTVHIDHQLQPGSSEWSTHCGRIADKLEIPFLTEKVSVDANAEDGLEAAARAARYEAMRRTLARNEVLLTAHHADDQAETLLLALMRGSGVQGLASMPARKEFAQGWHVRPLLPFTRAELAAWANTRRIDAIDDPSNANRHHDRNFLRHEVLPILRSRWSSVATGISRSAGHLGEALVLLEGVAVDDLRACEVGRCLKIDALRELSAPRRRNLLRCWLRANGFLLPSTRRLAAFERDLFNSASDRMPCVKWSDVELRWHRGLLYAERASPFADDEERIWDWRNTIELPSGLGSLSMRPSAGSGLALERLSTELSIRFRAGREKIRLPGREHRHALRNLLQESDVLPWWRDRVPLIYAGPQLIAVGDFCFSDEIAARPGERAGTIVWEGAPQWRAVDCETRDTRREPRSE